MSRSVQVILGSLLALSLLCPSVSMAETLSIPGTGDGTAVLKAIGAAFSQQHPNVRIEVPKSTTENGGIKGSGGGVKAAGTGRAIIARVARGIKDKEKHFGLTYTPYANIPAVFFTSQDVPIEYLSSEQICAIYSGKVTNWKEVGGPDLEIRVIRREDGDSTLKVLQKSFPGFGDIKISDSALLARNTPEIFRLMHEKNRAIGFGPYDVAKSADVRIIKVDGRDPTFSGYPSHTTLGFVYQEKALTDTAKKFLEFATSKNANLPIIVAGGIPLK